MIESFCKTAREDGSVNNESLPLGSFHSDRSTGNQKPPHDGNEPSEKTTSLETRNPNANLEWPKNPDALLSHREMCQELGISPQTGYDWRNPRSSRYKVGLAGLAIYLSGRTVRFRRRDIQEFALQRKLESKS